MAEGPACVRRAGGARAAGGGGVGMSVLTTDTLGRRGAGNVSRASSRDFCEQLTRAQARNFYFGLKLLPEPKRSAMFTLYAYMRLVDDIADDDDGKSVEQRVRDLDDWRARTHAVLAPQPQQEVIDSHPLWPAFADIARRTALPAQRF